MAYGSYRGRRSYRRRLGGSSTYASTFGMRPVPFKRKRPTTTATGAPVRLGRRVRPKLARSYVLTKTKTKNRPGKVTTHGDNQSSSVSTIGKKWLSKFDKMLSRKIVSPQSSYKNDYGRVQCTQGTQGLTYFYFMTKTDMTAMETAANGGSATNNNVRLFLKTGKVAIKLRNQANTTAKVTLYDISTKRDPLSTSVENPVKAWDKGMIDLGAGLTGVAQSVPGATPFKSPEFRNGFYVNKATTVYLEPGQQHDHTVYHKYNRIIDTVRYQNNTSAIFAGLTRWVMVVFHGTLGHESATPGTVTFMPITLDYAVSYEYEYGWIEKTSPSFSLTDNFPKAVVDFDFMGESGDADVNAAIA